jgi:hypothetical protein
MTTVTVQQLSASVNTLSTVIIGLHRSFNLLANKGLVVNQVDLAVSYRDCKSPAPEEEVRMNGRELLALDMVRLSNASFTCVK